MHFPVFEASSALKALEENLSGSLPSGWMLNVGYLGGSLANSELSGGIGDDATKRESKQLVVRISGRNLHFARFPANKSDGCDRPCAECFDRRCIAWFSADAQWVIGLGYRLNGCPEYSLVTSATLVMANLLALRMTGMENDGPEDVLSFDLLTHEVTGAGLLPDPFCSCAQADDGGAPRPLVLRESLAAPLGDIRLKHLNDYDLPVRALVNPVCGAVGRGHIPGYAQTITAPVFGQYWQREVASKPRSVGWSGLCLRRADSELVGMLEALERQGGMQPPTAPPFAIAATLRQLGAQAMDPTLSLAYNEESFARKLGLTRFGPDLACNWTWGHSLKQGRPVLVPTALAFYHRPGASDPVKLVDNNSSGCAMGSCVEEALLKSLLELIERDSFVITWLRMLSLPKIDPASVADDRVQLLASRLDYLGVDLSLLDARLDIDVPVIIAVARRRDKGLGAMAIGAAAHINPVEAIRSAMLEAATSITELPALVRHSEKHVHALAEDQYRVTTVMDHQMLYGLAAMAEQTRWLDVNTTVRSLAQAYPEWRPGIAIDVGAEVTRLRQMLDRVGVEEVVVVDMTAREQRLIGLHTVRAIAPGLAPIDFGHPRNRAEALPRLWSAPLAAGFLADRSAPLNPAAHPFP